MRLIVVLWGLALSAPLAHAQPREADLPTSETAPASRGFDDEPTVDEVVHAVLENAQIEPSRIERAMRRARRRGWLPEVRLGVRRGLGRGVSVYQTGEQDRVGDSSDTDLMLEARVTFHLDRLVYAAEEVSLLREYRRSMADRDSLVRNVVTLYFERRRLLMLREVRGQLDFTDEVRVQEIEALLALMTGLSFG